MQEIRKDFALGVSIHHRGYKAYPEKYCREHVRLAAELGCNTLRINFIPQTDDDFRYLDGILADVLSYGMDMMLIMTNHSISAEEYGPLVERVAKRYTKGGPYGFIKYFQVMNEFDIAAVKESNPDCGGHYPDGDKLEHYTEEAITRRCLPIKAGLDAIKKHNPDMITIVNIGYLHYGFLQHLINRGLQWDMIGNDWYE